MVEVSKDIEEMPYFLYEVIEYKFKNNTVGIHSFRYYKSNKFLTIKKHKSNIFITLLGAPKSFINNEN